MELRRLERLVRSSILATPFTGTNAMTNYEVEGRKHLDEALERHRRTGRGLITISNHQSLFDDPMVLEALLGIHWFNVENKVWWSTPCEHNFSPAGSRPRDRFVRYFSDVSNMVFFERPGKNGNGIRRVDSYADVLARRVSRKDLARFAGSAAAAGLDLEDWLRRFVTPGAPDRLAAMNQAGMIEALARLQTGDWLHFFPEGGRSRSLSLREPKKGVGKVVYHANGADLLPICFYGMHDVLPIGSGLPRAGKRVVVSIGEPVPSRRFDELRQLPPTTETYQRVVEAAWGHVTALRPATLVRYLGPARAAELLLAEAPAAASPEGEVVGWPATETGTRTHRHARAGMQGR